MSCEHRGPVARRRVIALGAVLAAVVGAPRARTPIADEDGVRAHAEQAFAMRDRALAIGDRPYGAVVVRAGEVVGHGPSRVIVDKDPTAHAEVVAIRDACSRLATHDLSGCTLYTTSPPCPMCETAAYWAGIERVFTGAHATGGARPRYPTC